MGVETAIAVGALGAGANAYLSYQGAKSSAKDIKKQLEMQTNLQMMQLMRYKMLFGDIEKNLSNFYKNLSPETFTNIGGVNIEKQYATAQKNIDKTLMQRGLSQSGVAQGAVTNLELSKALAKADLQTKAPFLVADEKMKFLSLGKGIPAMALNNLSNIAGAQANYYAQLNQQYNQQFGNSLSGLFSLIGYGIGSGVFGSGGAGGTAIPKLLSNTTPTGQFTLLPSSNIGGGGLTPKFTLLPSGGIF